MTITTEDLQKLLPGTQAVVTACEANEHGDNQGCLCKLKGQTVIVAEKYETVFVGTPTWWLRHVKTRQPYKRTARLSELTLVCDEA